MLGDNAHGETERVATLVRLLKDPSAASAAEYAIILAILGTVIAIAALALGGAITTAFTHSTGCISSGCS